MNRREYLRNWWDLSRGANVVWGCSTIVLGSVLIGVNYEENLIPLALHAFCIRAFIAGWFAINDLLDIDIDKVNHPQRVERRFVIGGPHGDCGLTGRKIIVDTYGGYAPRLFHLH